MNEREEQAQKAIGTEEWYDFVGMMAEALPGMHVGGGQATEALLGLCAIEAGSRVLDVGCGGGNTACQIAAAYGARVEGIDLSEVMVGQARARAKRLGLAGRVTFRQGSILDLPYEEGSFDLALVESVLVPLPGDAGQAVREMARVVRPGGRVAANEGTIDPGAPADLQALFAEHPAIHAYFTPESLRALFEGAGLEVTHLKEVRQGEAPSPLRGLGLGQILSFMVRVYPRIVLKLLRDPRFRRASQVDKEVTTRGKEYMGYALIVGRKVG
jgi:ubiquinone/menaquinone biosynthesis C-methylase UbiE